MKRMQNRVCFIPVLMLLSVFLFAHEGATGVIKERMDLMSSLSKSVKTVSAMMKGRTEYDADIVKQEAEKISALAGSHMTMLFPENSVDDVSEALPEIWQDWEAFERYAMELEVAAKGLVLAAGNTGSGVASSGDVNSLLGLSSAPTEMTVDSLAAMPSQDVFKKVSQSCSGCHRSFRMDKD